MIPQPSYPPERQTGKLEPDRSSYRSDCMYIHYNTSNHYPYRGNSPGVIRPPDASSVSAQAGLNRIPDPHGCSTSASGGSSPPVVRGPDPIVRSPGWCGAVSVDAVPINMRVEPPDKGKCKHGSVEPPGVTPNSILIQSNRKNRPFYNPSSWAVPKTWRSPERENFLNHFLPLRTSSRTELAQARMRGPEINNNSTKNKG
jgi:hypothetical protein